MHMLSRIVILRGGPGQRHETSLESGNHIKNYLEDSHELIDVVVDKQGNWYVHGLAQKPADILKHAHVAVNAVYGTSDEHGVIQHTLEHAGVPYTGSQALASALSRHIWHAKKVFKMVGIKTPNAVLAHAEKNVSEQALSIFKTCVLPVIIKPVDAGVLIGTTVARDLSDIENALVSVFQYCNTALVEEFIRGKEASVVVLENFRDAKHYAFPPVETVRHTDATLGTDSKNKIEVRCPGNFSRIEKDVLMQTAINAHVAIGARHCSKSNFVVHPTRGIFILNIHTTPDISEGSSLPQTVESIGSNMQEFLKHIIGLALNTK